MILVYQMLNVRGSTTIHVSIMTKQHVGDRSYDMAFAKHVTDASNVLAKHVTNIRIVIAKHVSNIRLSLANHVLYSIACVKSHNMHHELNIRKALAQYKI